MVKIGKQKMLSKETCQKIWHCHREIETGRGLLVDVENVMEANVKNRVSGDNEVAIKDVFGRDAKLQLGVPSGENSQRLFDVTYELAKPVIEAHISRKVMELTELNEIAKLEAQSR